MDTNNPPDFDALINRAIESMPASHGEAIRNVAFLLEDEPTPEQRVQLQLHHDQTLLGLYEGVPLAARGGNMPVLPDRITLFRLPLMAQASNEAELYEAIRHTIWHELAHYFGHDHDAISALE